MEVALILFAFPQCDACLHFLKDTLTPRVNIDGDNDEDGIYQINNPPSAKAARKIREQSRENAECVMTQIGVHNIN